MIARGIEIEVEEVCTRRLAVSLAIGRVGLRRDLIFGDGAGIIPSRLGDLSAEEVRPRRIFNPGGKTVE